MSAGDLCQPSGPDGKGQAKGQARNARGEQRHQVGRDRPGQLRLLPQHRDIGQAVPAQGDRGGQVRDDLARVVDRPRCTPPVQARL